MSKKFYNHNNNHQRSYDSYEALVAAVEDFCRFLNNKCFCDQSFKDINQNVFGGYKATHKEHSLVLKNKLYNGDLLINSFYSDFIPLFNDLKIEDIINNQSILIFIDKLLEFKPNFGRSGCMSKLHVEILTNITNKIKDNYNSLSIKEPFTQSNASQMNPAPRSSTQIIDDAEINEEENEGDDQQQQPVITNNSNNNLSNNSNANSNVNSNAKQIVDNYNFVINISNKNNNNKKSVSINDDELLLNKIKNSYKRAFKKENNIKIIQFHLDNETTPAQLFTKNWPEIFLPNDQDYVDLYNKRIKEFSKILMKDMINRLKEQIMNLNSNILEYKSKLSNFDELEDRICDIINEVNESLKQDFIKADIKAKRIVFRPILIKDTSNINLKTNNDNNNKSNVKRVIRQRSRSRSINSNNMRSRNQSRSINRVRSNSRSKTSKRDKSRSISRSVSRSVSTTNNNKINLKSRINIDGRRLNRSKSRSMSRQRSIIDNNKANSRFNFKPYLNKSKMNNYNNNYYNYSNNMNNFKSYLNKSKMNNYNNYYNNNMNNFKRNRSNIVNYNNYNNRQMVNLNNYKYNKKNNVNRYARSYFNYNQQDNNRFNQVIATNGRNF
jgi:hypothetical protein